MANEYLVKKTFDFEVITEEGAKAEKFYTVDENGESLFTVTILESLKEVIEATNEISEKETSDLINFINDNGDFIGDSLASIAEHSESLSQVQDVVYSTFTGLPDLDVLLSFLVSAVVAAIELAKR